MIDARGKALHRNLVLVLNAEEEEKELLPSTDSDEAMEQFDKYMNHLNGTKGCLYDKHGNLLMEA